MSENSSVGSTGLLPQLRSALERSCGSAFLMPLHSASQHLDLVRTLALSAGSVLRARDHPVDDHVEDVSHHSRAHWSSSVGTDVRECSCGFKNAVMNSVHLIGRLATDVELKEVDGGSEVASFVLAVDRNAEEADFALLRQ